MINNLIENKGKKGSDEVVVINSFISAIYSFFIAEIHPNIRSFVKFLFVLW